MIIDELVAILGYKIEGQDKLRQFARGIDDAENKARRSARAFSALGSAAGGALAGFATAGTIKAAVQQFAQLERSVDRIGITAGASASETQRAGQVLQRMAKDFAMPLDQVVAGLDTLTASGKSLDEAMAFLPSVVATAQASGAATEDVANTAIKAADALKIETKELQKSFDIMVTGGKLGQFELKDMAQYIPDLANGFAALGYKGTSGLRKLIAVMQTLRQNTGSASAAADQARNLFTKIYAKDTSDKFKAFGINLNAELAKAKASGKDILSTFIQLTNKAINGDLSKLPLLFTDQEFLGAMRTLVTSEEAVKKFYAALSEGKVDGAVLEDLKRILDGTQAKIDSLQVSWDRFMNAIGKTAAGPLGSAMDWASERLAYGDAVQEGLKKEGVTDQFERNKRVIELKFDPEEQDRLARLGGFVPSSGSTGYELADARLSPLQVERKKLERERDALEAKRASVESLRVLRGTPGAEHKARELTRFGLDIGDVNAKINRTYPVDPDRHKPFIGSQVAPPMPPSRPEAAASVVNDNRQDNRQYPVTNHVTVNQTVQQVTQAPAAAASATAGAVRDTLQPARMQQGPQP